MRYPNRLQAAIMLDGPFDGLDEVVRNFARISEMKTGATFAVPETRPGSFARLFGGDADLMLTFEYVQNPPVGPALERALASPVATMLTEHLRQRMMRVRSHIALDVSHGPLAGIENDPKLAGLMSATGLGPAGASIAQFHQRIETLALMARIACDHSQPVAVYWHQSNQLLGPESFEELIRRASPHPAQPMDQPNALTVHPVLFGSPEASGSAPTIGLVTYGLQHWLGREIVIPATGLPWAAGFDAALAFARSRIDGPDEPQPQSDTFRPARCAGEETWRVESGTAEDLETGGELVREMIADAQFTKLVPLRHDGSGFLSPGYARQAQIIANRPARDDGPHEDANASSQPEAKSGSDPEDQTRAEAETAEPTSPRIVRIGAASVSAPGSNLTGRGLRQRVFGRKDN
jgi:hypothetical protein